MSIQSFWKPVKSKPMKSVKNYGMPNLNKYPKRTSKENRLIKTNPYGDRDRDGVMNYFDCKPLDKTQDSKMLRREVARRIYGAEYYSGLPPEGYQGKKKPMGKILVEQERKTAQENLQKLNKRYAELYENNPFIRPGKKIPPRYAKGRYKTVTSADVVKVLAKNPDLIKYAEEVKWSTMPIDYFVKGHRGAYGKNPEYYAEGKLEPVKKKEIMITSIAGKRYNITHAIKHEIAHHKQWREAYEGDWTPLLNDKKGKQVWAKNWIKAEKEEEEKLREHNIKKRIELVRRKQAEGMSAEAITREYIDRIFVPDERLPWSRRPIEIDAELRARQPHARQIKLQEAPQALQKLPKIPVAKVQRKPFDKIDEELQEKLIQQGGDIRQIRNINNALARIKKRREKYQSANIEVPNKKEWEMTKEEWVEAQTKKVSGQSVAKTRKLANLLHSDFVKIWKAEGKIKDDKVKLKPKEYVDYLVGQGKLKYKEVPGEILEEYGGKDTNAIYTLGPKGPVILAKSKNEILSDMLKSPNINELKKTGIKPEEYAEKIYQKTLVHELSHMTQPKIITAIDKKLPYRLKPGEMLANIKSAFKKSYTVDSKLNTLISLTSKELEQQAINAYKEYKEFNKSDGFEPVDFKTYKKDYLENIAKRIVQKENTPTEEYKKIEDVDKSELKRAERLEKESQRENKKIIKLEKEAKKEKQIMEKESKKSEMTWSKMSEYEKRQVGKVAAKEFQVPEYMQDRFAAEIAKS